MCFSMCLMGKRYKGVEMYSWKKYAFLHYKEIFRGKNAARRKFGEGKVINEAVLSVEDCKRRKGKMCHNKINGEKSGV